MSRLKNSLLKQCSSFLVPFDIVLIETFSAIMFSINWVNVIMQYTFYLESKGNEIVTMRLEFKGIVLKNVAEDNRNFECISLL